MWALDPYCEGSSFLHRRDARAKLAACFALVAAVSAVDARHPERLAPCAALLALLLVLGRISPLLVLRRSLIVLPFVLLPVLSAPFLRAGAAGGLSPWEMAALIAGRAWLAAAVLATLMATTRYADFLDGAARLRTPRLLVTLAAFLYRYLFVLVEEVGRMLLARDLRRSARGGLAAGARVAGPMVAALFLRTYDRSERIHQCMLARGFEGEARRVKPKALDVADWAFVVLFVAAVVAAWSIGVVE